MVTCKVKVPWDYLIRVGDIPGLRLLPHPELAKYAKKGTLIKKNPNICLASHPSSVFKIIIGTESHAVFLSQFFSILLRHVNNCIPRRTSGIQCICHCKATTASQKFLVCALHPTVLIQSFFFKFRSHVSCIKVQMPINFGRFFQFHLCQLGGQKGVFLCALLKPEFSTNFLHIHTKYVFHQGPRFLAPCSSICGHQEAKFIYFLCTL